LLFVHLLCKPYRFPSKSSKTVKKNCNAHRRACLTLVGLSKACGAVPREALFGKVCQLGVRGRTLEFVKAFCVLLRWQRTREGAPLTHSLCLGTETGVPFLSCTLWCA